MIIQCKLGPAQPVVGGHTYDFRPDEHGRYVADVQDIVHQMVMLSVEHYVVAPEIVLAVPEHAPADVPAPAPIAAQDVAAAVAPADEPVVSAPTEAPSVSPSSAQNHRGRRGKRRG